MAEAGVQLEENTTAVTCTSVWVGSIAPGCTSEQLLDHFSNYRSWICNIPLTLCTSRNTSAGVKKDCFSILNFNSSEKAQQFIKEMNYTEFMGKKLKVKEDRKKNTDLQGPNSRKMATQKKQSDLVRSPVKSTNATGAKQTSTVVVSNLPMGTTSDEVLEHLCDYQSLIVNIKNIPVKSVGKNSEFLCAYLHFSSVDVAEKVVKEVNRTSFKGATLNLWVQNSQKGKSSTQTTHESSPSSSSSSLKTIYVGNVPHGIDNTDLTGLVAMLKPIGCNVSGQTATISFASSEQAEKAVEILHQKNLLGVNLTANLCSSVPFQSRGLTITPTSPQRHPPPFVQPVLGGTQNGHHKIPITPQQLPLSSFGPPSFIQQMPPNPTYGQNPCSIHPPSFPGGFALADSSVNPYSNTPLNRVSRELYDFICKTEEAQFRDLVYRNNGTVKYIEHESKIEVNGPQTELAKIVNLFQKFTEKEVSFSFSHWNSLIALDPKLGNRKLDSIIAPYQCNPALKIIEGRSKLLIVGLTDAVLNASQHLSSLQKKEIQLDSAQLAALVYFEPNLPQQILNSYGVSIKGYSSGSAVVELENANDESVQSIESFLNQKLKSLCCKTVSKLPPPLINAAKKESPSVFLKEEDDSIAIWSQSEQACEKARKVFVRKPYCNTIDSSIFEQDSHQVNGEIREKFSGFEDVHMRCEDESIILEGFSKESVQKAKKVILEYMKEHFSKKMDTRVVEQYLKCTEAEQVYLAKVLQTEKCNDITEIENVKVFLKDGKVCLKGTKANISEASITLISYVPSHSKHVFEGKKNHHFLSRLLEKHCVLKETDCIIKTKDRIVVYVFIEHSSEDGISNVQGQLEAMDPSIIFISASTKEKDIVKEIANELQGRERCHIDLAKSRPKIAIYGLTRAETMRTKQAINDHINENLIVFRHLPSTPISALQMKYILTLHKKALDEKAKHLKDYRTPTWISRKSAFDLVLNSDDEVSIKVNGTLKQIKEFDDFLVSISSADSFVVNEFHVSPQNLHRFPWKKRWEIMKQRAYDDENVLIEYKLPEHGSDSDKVDFIIYGNQLDVLDWQKKIESEINDGVCEDKIKLSSDLVKKVEAAIKRDKKLNFNDYVVKVVFNEKYGIVYINTLAVTADCIQLVKEEIQAFVEGADTGYMEVLQLDDALVYHVFSSKKFSYYSDTFSIARKLRVNFFLLRKVPYGIRLTGNRADVDNAKMQIKALIDEQIKANFDKRLITFSNPVHLCVLADSEFKKKLERKFLYDYSVKLSFIESSSTANPQWSWRNDKGGYSPYSVQECKLINQNFSQNSSSSFSLTINGASYMIDFCRMVQIRNSSKHEREITTSKDFMSSFQWYWTNDNQIVQAYTDDQSAKLEEMYQTNNVQSMQIGSQMYRFDLQKMEQVNIRSGYSRKIVRKPVQKQQLGASNHGNQQEDINVCGQRSELVKCSLTGPRNNLKEAEDDLCSQIRQLVREEKIPLLCNDDKSFLHKMEEIAAEQAVIYSLEAGSSCGKKVLVIKGSSGVDKAVLEVQKYLIEQQSTNDDVDLPQEWQPTQSETTKLFPVQKGSNEWNRVEQIFNQTMSSYSIRNIDRIQNLYLWEKWLGEKKRIEKFKGSANEKELFHGTRNNDPKIIYDSEIGFDSRFCTSGMWGRANYFAVNASYSHHYAHTDNSGQRQMFLVRLITGDSYECQSNSSLTMPPLKNDTRMGLSQVRYDTVTGSTGGSRVFMSYDNQKAYPAYLIKY